LPVAVMMMWRSLRKLLSLWSFVFVFLFWANSISGAKN
jgi:hypothetical protein